MKKILSVTLAIMLTMLTLPVSAVNFSDVDPSAPYYKAVSALSTYGIIGGFDGMYKPENYLTRAEFAKISVITAGLDSAVHSNSSAKLFTDVSNDFWANGFINTAARNQIIIGYPDGTFLPDNRVTFGEAVTIALRLLDYTDLGDNWPVAHVNKAREIGLADGISLTPYDHIDRGSTAMVFERALETELNGSKDKLISKMDFTTTDEAIIIATANEDPTLLADEVKTSIGNYRSDVDISSIPVMSRAKLVVNNKNRRIVNLIIEDNPRMQDVIIESNYENSIAYTDIQTGSAGQLRLENETVIYHRGATTNYTNVRSSIDAGSEMLIVYTNSGVVDYAMLKDAKLSVPIAVSDNVTDPYTVSIQGINFNSATKVIRNGLSMKVTDIKMYDVIYYSPTSNTLYVYSDKISGIYEKAMPNKAAVSSVTISGVTRSIETEAATRKLGEHEGSFKIGARITALLGRNGDIVDVVSVSGSEVSSVGVIVGNYEQTSTDIDTYGRLELFTKVLTGSGQLVEYKSDNDYEEMKGRIVNISFDNNGLAKFISANRSSVSGDIDKHERTIGDYKLDIDAKIIEIQYVPSGSSSTGVDADVNLIELTDIPYTKLDPTKVRFVDIRGEEIHLLIVENLTGMGYNYGYMTRSTLSGNSVGGRYTIAIDGITREYNISGIQFPTGLGGVKVRMNGNSLSELKLLQQADVRGKFESINFEYITIGGERYALSPDVQIYKKHNDFDVAQVSIHDVADLNPTEIKLYIDESFTYGGYVRIIHLK